MKPFTPFRMLVVCLVLFSLIITPQRGWALHANSVAQQDSPTLNFCITDIPTIGTFPVVKFNFRVFDQKFEPVKEISDQDLRVSENGLNPISLTPGMLSNEQGLGVDYFIVVDRSNRIGDQDQLQVKAILDSFVSYFDESKDQVKIVTDENNGAKVFYPSPTATKLSQAIANFPTERGRNLYLADNALSLILDEMEGSFNTCQKPKILIVIVGDDSISKTMIASVAERAKKSSAKLFVFHAKNHWSGVFQSRADYEEMAKVAGGKYIQITPDGDAGRSIFNTFINYRHSFSATYRTGSGVSGAHVIGFQYQGINVPAKGSNSYTVSLLQPQATLAMPSSIVTRIATRIIDGGYVYDKVAEIISVNVAFPDGYPRKISSKAVMIINQAGKGEVRVPIILTSSSGDAYQFSWDLENISDPYRNDLGIKIELVDELNFSFVSADTSVAVLNNIPANLLFERFLVYIMAGVVFLLIIALIVMWRRMGNLVVKGREVISNVAGAIRKTIVGGGKRGKPLATIKIIDGPPSMINQELKIYSESIKLGRDPQKADMTFYAPDANSSVSGLHARIEKVNGIWRIVAVSSSGSETFVDESPIPFNEPYSLNTGQVIRLGYLAQQPVVFSFNSEVSGSAGPRTTIVGGIGEDLRRTQVDEKTVPVNVVKVSADKRESLKQSKEESDNIFDEFRERE